MKKHFFSMVAALSMLTACGGASQQTTAEAEKFDYNVEQFTPAKTTGLLSDRSRFARSGYSL